MMNQPPAQEAGLSGLLAVIRRRLWVILLCFFAVVGAAIAVSLAQDERYSTTATLLFRDPQLDQKLFGSDAVGELSDPVREAETNLNLVSLDVVADRTARQLGRPSSEAVEEQVEATPEGQSDLVSVTATAATPAGAATLANTFAEQYIEFRQEADREKISEALGLVEAELDDLEATDGGSTAQRSLRERLEQLTVLASLQTGNAELVQQAEPPTSPSSPNVELNAALGAVVGLLLAIALAFLVDRLDKRIREPDEMEGIVGRPVLGVIPHSRALPREGANVDTLPPQELEAFNMIRTNLRYSDPAGQVSSVLITSAGSGDGKTTVAWNVAAAAAKAGASTVLVEADLRRPALENRLDVRAPAGLPDLLAGLVGLNEATVQIPVSEASNGGEALRLVDVIFARIAPPNPIDLIESAQMEEVLRELELRYDAVFIDSPPISVVSDSIPLLSRVDGVLIVTRLKRTTRDALHRLANQLQRLDARTLGIVVNDVPFRARGYGYGYAGYGDAYAHRSSRRSKRTGEDLAVGRGLQRPLDPAEPR